MEIKTSVDLLVDAGPVEEVAVSRIADLRDAALHVYVEGEVVGVSEVRIVSLSHGPKGRVADATIQDSSGKIKLSLWDNLIDRVRPGFKVRVINGYTNSFRGEMRLNVGMWGTLEVEPMTEGVRDT